MKNYIAFLFIFLVSYSAFSQQKKPTTSMRIPVAINWAKGETSYFKITQHDENIETNHYSKIFSEKDVRLVVIEKTDTSYTLQWTYTNIETTVEDYQLRGAVLRMGNEEETKALTNKLLESCEESAKGMKVLYTTDQFGGFKDIINRDQIREQYKNHFTSTINVLMSDMPSEIRDSMAVFFNYMTDVMVSDPNFGINFDDIQLLHTAYGHEYAVGQTLTAVSTWPSPISDKNYPAHIELTMNDYDSKLGMAAINGVTILGKEAIQMFNEDMHLLMTNYKEPAILTDIFYEIKSDYNLNIDLNYGWVYDAHIVTHKKVNHDSATSVMDIKLRL